MNAREEEQADKRLHRELCRARDAAEGGSQEAADDLKMILRFLRKLRRVMAWAPGNKRRVRRIDRVLDGFEKA